MTVFTNVFTTVFTHAFTPWERLDRKVDRNMDRKVDREWSGSRPRPARPQHGWPGLAGRPWDGLEPTASAQPGRHRVGVLENVVPFLMGIASRTYARQVWSTMTQTAFNMEFSQHTVNPTLPFFSSHSISSLSPPCPPHEYNYNHNHNDIYIWNYDYNRNNSIYRWIWIIICFLRICTFEFCWF